MINFPIDNRTFNENCPTEIDPQIKLLSTKDGEVIVQPMWRMELLAKFYGVNIYHYDDSRDQRYYDELLCCLGLKESRELADIEDIYPDNYELYFEHLAQVAAQVGAQRAEIKCLIKSLILKYYKYKGLFRFPHKEFVKIYRRLIESDDSECLRVARRLSRLHVRVFETRYKIHKGSL